MLEARGVRKRFGGVEALRDAELELGENEIVGLIGPNGSGKTTMLNVLSGFTPPDAGEIRLQGARIDGMNAWQISKSGLRRTFQHPGMPAMMSPREVLLCGAKLGHGERIIDVLLRPRAVRLERHTASERADEMLEVLQLTHVGDTPSSDLSGGQQKLLSLGVALMDEPSVLLLDEPTAGVNPTLRVGLVEAIKQIRARGTTVLIVEHDMDFIGALCERVYVLDKGRNVVMCHPQELHEHPEVVEAYLGQPVERRRRASNGGEVSA